VPAVELDHLGVFGRGAPVIALPNWRAPRLLLSRSGGPLQRWREAAFFPASRPMAKAFRLVMRGKAFLGCGEVHRAVGDDRILREFVGDCLPATEALVIQTRPPGPDQKLTIELRDRAGTIIGYVKYGTEPLARQRLAREHEMLTRLPAGMGPAPLKFADMGEGLALLVAPLYGRPVGTKLPPPPEVLEFTKSLTGSDPLPIALHPYIRGLRDHIGRQFDIILTDLAGRDWPIALGHGDYVPWNLRWDRDSRRISAFDWEFGTLEGFPFVDLAYFILQVAALLYSWPAVKAAIYATQWLAGRPMLGLSEREARGIIRLAMFHAYSRARAGGFADGDGIQAWRLRIWRGLW
jgi:hypothetical protein